MTHLLDTNACIRLMNDDQKVVAALQTPDVVAVMSCIVLFELTYGAFRSARIGRNLQSIAELPFAIIGFEPPDAQAAAEVRAFLIGQGKPIGPYDILIAGQALARDLTLVTHNTREFARVPGLRLEDWEL